MITRIRNGHAQPWQKHGGDDAPLPRIVAKSAWDRSKSIFTQHPQGSLIAALTAGVVLGWIIKRR